MKLYVLVTLIIVLPQLHSATRITGTYKTDEFFRFLNKFGFQKTDKHSQKDSYGYIFGNITSNDDLQTATAANHYATLAVLDRYHFMEFYENRTVKDRDAACQAMFAKIERTAFDVNCNPTAKGDYLRRVPCKNGGLCVDEDQKDVVVPGSQFTYTISDLMQPRWVQWPRRCV